jgi:hypothetical protein
LFLVLFSSEHDNLKLFLVLFSSKHGNYWQPV